MLNKLKILLILIILNVLLTHKDVLAAKSENINTHDAIWGARSQRDVHMIRQIVMDKAKTMRVISGDYEFRPKPGDLHYGRTITQIQVTDQYKNGNGGYATLKDGGPSTNYAVIHLKSQRNHGYNFIIDIYGQ
ncbi:probable salivary secreted peptide [Lucilia cuprina]|uniref:probable salivary secreted peptide n=1 Tax=Lucilia cuprina TaxID=7375 RepID=UPI001F06CC17|nr:probable salivary secreted peptide [Lucilia cuprina]